MTTEIRIRPRFRRTKRHRASIWRAGNVSICQDCIAHFGEGYGPLEGAKLGASVRYHRANAHPDRWDDEGKHIG